MVVLVSLRLSLGLVAIFDTVFSGSEERML